MIRRRGTQVAERVEQQDPGHDAEPERQHDDHEVLGLEAERVGGEAGSQHAQHADQRGREREVQ